MITGANEYVQIQGLGAEPLPPGVVCPPGASYCTGPSHLSPAELAKVQAENHALQVQSAQANTRTHWAMAFGAVLIVGAGVAYAVHKR